jgi:threonine aldolase
LKEKSSFVMIDLRSDTVTKPTKPMLQAMFEAEVGDDVFDEDPTVKKLESKTARLFGKEAGLFCPSGTMTNQVGIKVITQPQQEVICDQSSHIYYYEGGGLMFNSGLSVRLIAGDRGRITSRDVLENINPDNIHQPSTALVALENTSNKGGGSFYRLQEAREIAAVCQQHKLKMHLDGARIFNALAETSESAMEWGALFDTVSICLSKGLGAPVGSVLLSSKENIARARRVRKAFGGNMRQSGYLAAAGIYALDHHVDRLKEDHGRARALGKSLSAKPWVKTLLPVDTNIVVFTLQDVLPVEKFLETLKGQGILAVPFGRQTVRMVTHLDFNDTMLDQTLNVLNTIVA